MNNPESAKELLDQFMAFATSLAGRVQGWERSAKFTPTHISAQRWLFGFDKQQLSWKQVVSHSYFNDFPAELLSEIEAYWEQANFCYCAIDIEPSASAKFYLEFPVLLSTETASKIYWEEPAIWCTGYKFDRQLDHKKRTQYFLLPGYSVEKAFARSSKLHSFGLSKLMTHFLEKKAHKYLNSIDILCLDDVFEAPALDFRLYDLDLRVSDWVDYLNETPYKLEWITKQQAAWLHLSHQWGHSELGHLSLGVGKDQEPYINLYWAADENQ